MITYNGGILISNSGYLDTAPVPTPIDRHILPDGLELGDIIIEVGSPDIVVTDPQHHLSASEPVIAVVVMDEGSNDPYLVTRGSEPLSPNDPLYDTWESQGFTWLITQPATLWHFSYTDVIRNVAYAYMGSSNFSRYSDGWMNAKLRNCKTVNVFIDNSVTTFNKAFIGEPESGVEEITINSASGPSSIQTLYEQFQNNGFGPLRVVDFSHCPMPYLSDMHSAFAYCKYLTHVYMDEYGLNPLEYVTDMSTCFYLCSELIHFSPLSVGKQFALPVIGDVKECFNQCAKLEADILRFYQQASANISQSELHQNCFTGCSIQASSDVRNMRASIPISWGGDLR